MVLGMTTTIDLSRKSAAYQEAMSDVLRADAKGKPCGKSHIPADRECRVGQGVANSQPRRKTTLSSPSDQSPQNLPKKKSIGLGAKIGITTGVAAGITAGAAVLGVPVATYMATRAKYRKGFEKSAQMAKEQASKVKVDDVPKDQTHITIATGGFNVGGEGGYTLADNLKKAGFDHHFVPMTNYEFDTRTLKEKEEGKEVKFTGNVGDFFVRGNKAFFRSVVKQGYNPVSVKIAAEAYAYHQKYPDKTISIVGHSAGGIASHEAAEILQKMGVKTQVLAIGSPYFGMTEPTEKTMTLASKKDPVVAPGNVMKAKWTKSKSHSVEDYFADPESLKAMKEFLGGVQARKDSDPTQQSDPQIAQALKQVIESSFSGGIDAMLGYKSEPDGTVNGQFRDANEVYNFTISPANKLTYIEADQDSKQPHKSKPKPEPSNQPKQDSGLVTLDSRKCKEGKPCGGTCIARGRRCNVKLNGQAANLMNQVRERLKGKNGSQQGQQGQAGLGSPAALPAIPVTLGGMGQAGAIAAGALLVGMPVATYTAVRANYRKGYDESAKQAKEMASGVEVPDLGDDKTHVTFAVGGFAGDSKGGERVANELKSKDMGLGNHHIEWMRNDEFDVRTKKELEQGISRGKDDGNPVKGIEFPVRALQTFMRTTLNQGRNPVAVKLAAQAYAYHQKYPDKPINLVGHSAGGITVRETAELLEKMGVKSKVVAIGSPHFGIAEPTEDNITIATAKDPILNATGNAVMKGTWFNSVKGHQIKDYFGDPEVREFLSLHLNPLSERPENKKTKRSRGDTAKPICKEGKPCGKICIPKKANCKSENPRSEGTSISSTQTEAKKKSGSFPAVAAGLTAGAALLAIPVGAYTVQVSRYKAGFNKSAELAKQEAKGYQSKVPQDLKAGFRSVGDQGVEPTIVQSRFSDQEPDQITFFTGGFGGVAGKEGDFLGEEFSSMFPKHHVVSVESPEFDVSPKPGDRVGNPAFIARTAKELVGDALKRERSPVAVRIAARAYAYHQQYPDKPINLIGQSGGTMPTREAAEILSRMGVKDVRVVSIAGPYFGATKPAGITLVSKKDPMEKMFGISMPGKRYINSVDGHSKYLVNDAEGSPKKRAEARITGKKSQVNTETQKVLTDYFDRSKRQDASEVSSNGFGDFEQQRLRFLAQLKSILERSYIDGIDQFMKIDISPSGDISGRFRDGRKLIEFLITDAEIETRLISGQRSDAYLDGAMTAITSIRFDAPRNSIRKKQKKCNKGMSCGYACISAGDVCRIGSRSVASPGEIQALRKQAQTMRDPGTMQQPDPYEGMTIRDLKKEASKRGVYRYSEMTSEQLKRAIRAADESPKQQDRIRKTLEKRKQARDVVEGGSVNKYVKSWIQIEKLFKMSNVDGRLLAGAAIAAFTGFGVKVYSDLKDRYRSGLRDSAMAAIYRAEKTPAPEVRKGNITFAVGGFAGEGSSGAEIKKRLEDLADKPDADASDRWFRDQNEIIPIDIPEFDIEPFPGNKRNPDGSYTPEYLGYLGTKGFGAFAQNFRDQRNEASVELASQIYAYANAKNRNGRFVNKNKPINIVAHSAGGLTAREALDIIALMPNGKDVLERVNLVSMSTPDFGFSEKRLAREISLTSGLDPLSILPQRYPKRINSVKGREISDFLGDENAVEQIRRHFGYYPTSTYYRERPKDKKPKQKTKTQGRQEVKVPSWLDPKYTGNDDPRKQADWGNKTQKEQDTIWNAFKKQQSKRYERSKDRKVDLKAQGKTTKEIEDILKQENLWFDSLASELDSTYLDSFHQVLACR